ncbi:MAG: mechanosensitive ion channel family protein [Gammaproteobacteria bacterium]
MDAITEILATVSAGLADYPVLGPTVGVLALLLLAWLADFIAQRQIVRMLRGVSRRTQSQWDDALARNKVFARFVRIVPALVVLVGAGWIPGLGEAPLALLENVAKACVVLAVALGLSAMLSAANEIYEYYPVARSRPIKGYLQLVNIGLFCVGAILIVSILLDESPLLLLSGFGAMTAVLMLVFRDTILSLVASIQIMSNDMVRVGDWIEMPRYDADGDVIDVALHTVKVQNWDKTVTTIPTHLLISESFRNWRGMSESGGRRIKRSLLLDQNSIRFLTDDEMTRFRGISLLDDYIAAKQRELSRDNVGPIEKGQAKANLRRLTNVGTFRAYIVNYLRSRADISGEMTFLVRQLAPSADGLPIEIYVFTNTTAWVAYESIQADIFDHLLAIIPEFGLRVFQNPSGLDLQVCARKES